MAEQDDVLFITEFQYKHLSKRSRKGVDYFDYCSDCGTSNKRKLGSVKDIINTRLYSKGNQQEVSDT